MIEVVYTKMEVKYNNNGLTQPRKREKRGKKQGKKAGGKSREKTTKKNGIRKYKKLSDAWRLNK